jgi:ATP-binding cassette, subfamily B, bacterial MsbA
MAKFFAFQIISVFQIIYSLPSTLKNMIDKILLKRILGLIKPHKTVLITAMACMVIVSLLTSLQAYMVKPLLDEIFFNQDEAMLDMLPMALVLLFIIKGVFYYSYSFQLTWVGQSVVKALRKRIFDHIHSLPVSFFHKTPSGELISRVISDVTLLESAVSYALVGILKDSLEVICLLFVVFYLNWKLALMTFVLLPMAYLPISYFGRQHRKFSTQNQQTTAFISNILHETIGGNRIVKAFCMEKYESKRFAAMVERLFSIIVKDVRVKSISHPVMELLGGFGVAFIIWYGGHQVIEGTSTPGTFFSFLTSLVMIYNPIKGISKINSTVQQGAAASVRVFNLLDIKADISDKPDAVTMGDFSRSIEFDSVHFSYDQETKILDDVSLKIKAGDVVAIVGPSGGGKTTLVNLIPRFFEVDTGNIFVDGNDIRDLTINSLRRQISMVTQQTILFNDTIRNNIAYGDPDYNEEAITEAARAAHALEFINRLPDGFDTIIGESGAKLSGGQQQRLSIARALLKNSPILILDEATSSLDTESEREVQKALENLMMNRTTLVIAHRLSTIRKADRIIVVQSGHIVEEGSHSQLLEKKGLYSSLYNLQYKE